MSKVYELRQKYATIRDSVFDTLVKGDESKTKKYLEYMLKMWTCKRVGPSNIPSSTALIKEVKRFDELLPYNDGIKDIYHKNYSTYGLLKAENDRVNEIKEDKGFVREDHANVIFENDDVLLVQPLTHRGSLKYGANTKWCTASKTNVSTFKHYTNDAPLFYLIDKKNSKGVYSKLAFYNANKTAPISGQIEIYNQKDTQCDENNIVNNGWSMQMITEFTFQYRLHHLEFRRVKTAKDEVHKVVNAMKSINLDKLSENLEIIKSGSNETKEVQNTINEFIIMVTNSLNDFKK
jgi:hypothetical protein